MAAQAVTELRRNQLLSLVRESGFASLPDLADELQVSESTIRRDLDTLEEGGAVKRTHGGVFYSGPSPRVPHFDRRQSAQWDQKRAIARAACELVDEGDTILLDGGSTTYELARLLVDRSLQVVTNSLPVANLFSATDRADLVLVGGYVHARTGVALGPYANRMLDGLNVRRAVLSISGANARGFYNSNLLLVGTEQAMMKAADEVIVVADSSKFGHASLARLCALSDVDTVVVDHGISRDWQDLLRVAGVHLVLADPADVAPAGNTT
jgi:DeoR family transcriptional regulator, fructose operon transcriptional repressor